MQAINKKKLSGVLIILLLMSTSVSAMTYQTGDILYKVPGEENVTKFYGKDWSLGYICENYGLFGASFTWNCKMTAVNLTTFAVKEIPKEILSLYKKRFSFEDAERSLWNKYGLLSFLSLAIFGYLPTRKKKVTYPSK